MRSLALFGVLTLSLFSQAAFAVQLPSGATPPDSAHLRLNPAPKLPAAHQTPIVMPFLKSRIILKEAAKTEEAIGKSLLAQMTAHPQAFNIPERLSLRVDYVKLVPAPDLTQTAYARFIQHPGFDVEGSQIIASLRGAADKMWIETVSGQLFPAVKEAPQPLLPKNQAQDLLQRRLKDAGLASPLVYEGSKIRWLQDAWRTTQEFLIPERSYHAAVDGNGETYLWESRVYTAPQNQSGKNQ